MRLPTVAAAILFAALAGCGGSDEKSNPTAADIKAGDCIADEISDEGDKAPDLSSVVACSEPHVYEVLDVVDLPKDALTGPSREERIANRKDLATADLEETSEDELSEQAVALGEFLGEGACDSGLLDIAGYADIEVDGVSARKAGLNPLFSTIQVERSNVMPEAQWLAGKRQVICSARFVEPNDDFEDQFSSDRVLKPVSSKNAQPVLANAGTASFPAAWRQCTAFKKGQDVSSPVGCDKQHYTETLFAFNAQDIIKRAVLDRINYDEPSNKDRTELDRVCATALPSVTAEGFDEGKVKVLGFTGVPWEDDAKFVTCELAGVPPKTTDLGPGSLIWTDASQAKLIDIG